MNESSQTPATSIPLALRFPAGEDLFGEHRGLGISSDRPLRRAEDDKGYAAAGQVLLVAHVFIGGYKDIETSRLGRGEQVTTADGHHQRRLACRLGSTSICSELSNLARHR